MVNKLFYKVWFSQVSQDELSFVNIEYHYNVKDILDGYHYNVTDIPDGYYYDMTDIPDGYSYDIKDVPDGYHYNVKDNQMDIIII